MLRKIPRAVLPAFLISVTILLFSATLGQVMAGCTSHQRHKTLRTTLTTMVAAREGFEKWDEIRQQQIVDAATSKEQGQEALVAFRAKRDAVYTAFEIGFRLIATASLSSDEESLAQAIDHAKKMLAKIAELQGGP